MPQLSIAPFGNRSFPPTTPFSGSWDSSSSASSQSGRMTSMSSFRRRRCSPRACRAPRLTRDEKLNESVASTRRTRRRLELGELGAHRSRRQRVDDADHLEVLVPRLREQRAEAVDHQRRAHPAQPLACAHRRDDHADERTPPDRPVRPEEPVHPDGLARRRRAEPFPDVFGVAALAPVAGALPVVPGGRGVAPPVIEDRRDVMDPVGRRRHPEGEVPVLGELVVGVEPADLGHELPTVRGQVVDVVGGEQVLR